MVEYMRDIKVKLYIDTNKRTIEKEWDSIEKAIEELETYIEFLKSI